MTPPDPTASRDQTTTIDPPEVPTSQPQPYADDFVEPYADDFVEPYADDFVEPYQDDFVEEEDYLSDQPARRSRLTTVLIVLLLLTCGFVLGVQAAGLVSRLG